MISEEYRRKIKDEFERTIDDVLRNNSSLSNIREIKIAADWYRKEGKIAPGKILSVINTHLIGSMSNKFVEEVSNGLEKQLAGTSIQLGQNGPSFSTFIPGIVSSFDVVLVANGMFDAGRITIGGGQDISIFVNEFKPLSSDGHKKIKIDKIDINVNLYLFTKMILGMKRKNILSHKFELNNIEVILN